jgi:hypothetical protein
MNNETNFVVTASFLYLFSTLGFNLGEGAASLEGNKVFSVSSLVAHHFVHTVLGGVRLCVSVHVPSNFLGRCHWVLEFLLWLLQEGS